MSKKRGSYHFVLFLTINLSKAAKTAGSTIKISKVAQRVPSDKVLQIFAAIAEANEPTMSVTIIRIDAEVKIV